MAADSGYCRLKAHDAHGTAGWNVTGCHRNAELKRGNLEIPVIGLAKSGWSLQQLHERAKSSFENHGGLAGTNDKFNVQLKDLSLLFLLISAGQPRLRLLIIHLHRGFS